MCVLDWNNKGYYLVFALLVVFFLEAGFAAAFLALLGAFFLEAGLVAAFLFLLGAVFLAEVFETDFSAAALGLFALPLGIALLLVADFFLAEATDFVFALEAFPFADAFATGAFLAGGACHRPSPHRY